MVAPQRSRVLELPLDPPRPQEVKSSNTGAPAAHFFVVHHRCPIRILCTTRRRPFPEVRTNCRGRPSPPLCPPRKVYTSLGPLATRRLCLTMYSSFISCGCFITRRYVLTVPRLSILIEVHPGAAPGSRPSAAAGAQGPRGSADTLRARRAPPPWRCGANLAQVAFSDSFRAECPDLRGGVSRRDRGPASPKHNRPVGLDPGGRVEPPGALNGAHSSGLGG